MPACPAASGRPRRPETIGAAVRRKSREGRGPHAFRAAPCRAAKAEPGPRRQARPRDEDRLVPAGRRYPNRDCRAAPPFRQRHACGIRRRRRPKAVPRSSARRDEASWRPRPGSLEPRAWISTAKDRPAQCKQGGKPDEPVDPVASMLPNALPLDIVVRPGDSFIRTIRWRDRHCPPASAKLFHNCTNLPLLVDNFSSHRRNARSCRIPLRLKPSGIGRILVGRITLQSGSRAKYAPGAHGAPISGRRPSPSGPPASSVSRFRLRYAGTASLHS